MKNKLIGKSFSNFSELLNYSKKIAFYYPEQTDFQSKMNHNDFDGEAMIYLGGKLHIFTKEWISKKTVHYSINPDLSAKQPAEKIEIFKTGFLVTDASYFRGKLYLLGYNKIGNVFLDIFKEENGKFFDSKPVKLRLGSALKLGQTEGIAVTEEGIYISCENFKWTFGNVPPTLYFIPFPN
jgi:hypothetical protein